MLSTSATAGQELSAGDFVRWCKQLLDLLDQLAAVAEPGVAAGPDRPGGGVGAVRRGVVAYSGTV